MMIFEITDKCREIKSDSIKTCNHTVAYLSLTEFERYNSVWGFDESIIPDSYDISNFRTKTEHKADYTFGILKLIEPEIENKTESFLEFIIKKNLIILINIKGINDYVRDTFINTVFSFDPKEFSIERFFTNFINNLISSDSKTLETIELKLNFMENRIIKDSTHHNYNEEILLYKRKLLNLRNYYEQLVDIAEELYANSNDLFCEENLQYFMNFKRKSERLCSDVNILRENINQLREIYQSALDLKLNNTMKLFTVITAIYSPLTLIAGWYGMNFRYMPELSWKYGYLFVISLSIAVFIINLIVFKKKKLI